MAEHTGFGERAGTASYICGHSRCTAPPCLPGQCQTGWFFRPFSSDGAPHDRSRLEAHWKMQVCFFPDSFCAGLQCCCSTAYILVQGSSLPQPASLICRQVGCKIPHLPTSACTCLQASCFNPLICCPMVKQGRTLDPGDPMGGVGGAAAAASSCTCSAVLSTCMGDGHWAGMPVVQRHASSVGIWNAAKLDTELAAVLAVGLGRAGAGGAVHA